MLIKAINNQTVGVPLTYLTNSEVGGTNVLRWKNPIGFNASWAVQVGATGENQTEIVLLGTATPSGTAGTLSANTLYDHPADTTLYAIKYDQLVFEVSTTGTSGTALPLSNGTVTIQAGQQYTQFDDTSGTSTYAYKTYFRNSALNTTSTESDWITNSGFSYYSLGKMRQRVKDKLVNASYLPDDTLINDWINEWLEIMTNAAIGVNEDYNQTTANIAVSASNGLGTVTNSDFKQLHRAWWIDGSGTYSMKKMDSNSFSPQRVFNETAPSFSWQTDTVFEVRPFMAGTVAIEYYKLNPVLVNDTDELPQPMKGYTNSFVNYALAQALYKDTKTEEAKTREATAGGALTAFKAESAPRTKTGPTMIEIVEDISPSDTIWF
jgi:hypothetical protein